MIDPILSRPGARMRAQVTLAAVLAELPEFGPGTFPEDRRELRTLVIAGKLLAALEEWLEIARIADQLDVR
jgi:hypothetical protein